MRFARPKAIPPMSWFSCPLTEARFFGALLFEDGALEACPNVETDDFSNLNYAHGFKAMRNIQASGEMPTLVSVFAWLDAHELPGVDRDVIAETILQPPYNFANLLQHDAWWLRRLAKRRRVA